MGKVRDERVLDGTWEWGRELPGFSRMHALHAVRLTDAFAGGLQGPEGEWVAGLGVDERAVELAALDLACVLWVDDWFDARGSPSGEPEGWEELAEALQGGAAVPPGLLGLSRLAARFRAAAHHPEDYRLWSETLLDVLRASHEDRLVSRGERSWSWGEYLENGEHNIAVAHTVFALSLAYGLGLAAMAGEPRFRRALRALCLATRLRNDLASAEKERREGNRANGLFVLECTLTPEQAFAFVDAERLGYERMLARELAGFEPSHPFPVIARVMTAAVERFYQIPNSRYGGT
jgi:hypothetical protein